MNRRSPIVRAGLVLLTFALISLLFPITLLRLSAPLRLDIGPGDRDYTQGLHREWRRQEGITWREMGRRGRLHLPVSLHGPGTLTLSVAQPTSSPVFLQVRFDDDTAHQVRIAPSREFRDVRFQIPAQRIRAHVRLRTETESGDAGRLRIDAATWEGRGERPLYPLARASFLIVTLTGIALWVAGASLGVSILGSLGLVAVLLVLGSTDPFAILHLVRKGAVVAGIGVLTVAIARGKMRKGSALFLSLVYVALLLKSFFVFHPRFYFVDYPIHETLLELVYHRGVVDFWARLPDYQVAHNLGVGIAGGDHHPFPYPVVFYFFAHVGNSLSHNPELWLKVTAALVSVLALFPLGYMARRLFPSSRADCWAVLIYLFTPALTRSLLLLEFSALTGHLFDLLVVAFLAKIAFDFSLWRRVLATSLLIATSAASYTSGFIHQGLLVGSCLGLAPWLKGLDRKSALRFALAGLAGAALGIGAYHPRTVANLFLVVLPTGIEGAPEATIQPWTDHFRSIVGRSLEFLGMVLPFVGTFSVIVWLRKAASQFSPALRLLIAAWAASCVVAFSLRFIFAELLLYQKELYWIAALFAVATGALIARLMTESFKMSLVAVSLSAAVVLSGLWQFFVMAPRFYWNYLFL